MKINTQQFSYEEYANAGELNPADASLLQAAKDATRQAYAPYSRFRVGAALQLANGQRVTGTNQENASYPVGICAERTALSAASAQYPGVAVETLAVSYDNELGPSQHPITPCGICRQTLAEYQQRFQAPIRLVLGGLSGKVIVIPDAALLLPLSFSSENMK
ncbi:cytidine deaminase [Chitinophaga alhagiae]|uniref:Cytidine deaminase n=1 Tax=Chitinophaga alhagiae TaxID=2203219 RepID=A0ABM6WDS7_9BACT|nr:cytidine deaminase [Chitinophaga alhagiae]AWO02149.1 cytidine deaminase [Chitinophaga alhagiae]